MVVQVVVEQLQDLVMVMVVQETHQAHHQVKVATVELLLLTTPFQVLALAVAVVLVGQQHQMAQMGQAQRLEMAQTVQQAP
jgi:hypothetical protein